VIERAIDPQSGMLATPYCPTTREEVFVAGTEPTSVCPLHAGAGEPVPVWQQMPAGSPTAEGAQRPEIQQPQQTPPAQRRERGIRRLLRVIFGSGQ